MDFKGLLDSAGKAVKDAADTSAKLIQKKLEEKKHRDKLLEYKREILNHLSTPQLETLGRYHAVYPKEPIDPNDYISERKGPKKKFVPNRADWIDTLTGHVTSVELIEWCQKNRIYQINPIVEGRRNYMKANKINDEGVKVELDESEFTPSQKENSAQPLQVQKPAKPEMRPLVKEILDRLEAMPVPKNFSNEEQAHYFVTGQLSAWFPSLSVKDEGNRKEVDVLVDDNIAIEIKNFINQNPSGEIQRLVGQINLYSSKYEAYIVLIFGGNQGQRNEIRRGASHDNVYIVIK